MSQSTLDDERVLAEHSEEEVLNFARRLIGRVWKSRPNLREALPIHESSEQQVVGYLVPSLEEPLDTESTAFLAKFRERLADRSGQILSHEEFESEIIRGCRADGASTGS